MKKSLYLGNYQIIYEYVLKIIHLVKNHPSKSRQIENIYEKICRLFKIDSSVKWLFKEQILSTNDNELTV